MAVPANSLRFSINERPTILAKLEEFTNVLAIYHGTLEESVPSHDDLLDCLTLDTDDFQTVDDGEIKEARERVVRRRIYENSLYMMNVMEELKAEISEEGTFTILSTEIDKITTREEEMGVLLSEQETLRNAVAELQNAVAGEKSTNEGERKRMLNELAEAQRNVEKLKLIADAELEYVTEWEKTRYEQSSLRRDMEIEKFEKILNERRTREKNQLTVHGELTKFLILDTAAIEERTREWEERYVGEKEAYKKEILRLRIEIETVQKKLDELEQEYRCNQEFIDAYLAEKEAVERARERRERMEKSAIKIQAWWRGVMVRRKLGPYRPAEKKKKRPKTKK
ncbi:dynein regulatory complex protein 9 [Ceratina calcarata]|uniref:Dynein regulatory complex protein 9 n=1 Tax=Ceratina calcarata TaxID=156304 RepID=A0AAJ7S1U0_9HYME|nr:dynein regulatory complex protein 9 [Ceratina calcarata]